MPILDIHDVTGVSSAPVFGRPAAEISDNYLHISDTNGMAFFGNGTLRMLG
jgi:hypothetical protein